MRRYGLIAAAVGLCGIGMAGAWHWGGQLLSQALTLFTTPVIYLYLDRLNAAQCRIAQQPRSRGCLAPTPRRG
jgi:hypothetical protein